MDQRARGFLRAHTDEVDEEAIYLLVGSASGVLLEDLAPLLTSIETAYRRLLVLRLSTKVRDLLVDRVSSGARLHGVSRSINSWYDRLMIPKEEDYFLSMDEKRHLKRDVSHTLQIEEYYQEPYTADHEWDTQYSPFRIEMGRSNTGSPGFLELVGDPYTFSALLGFLGTLFYLRQREQEQNHREELALHDRERANAEFLAEHMGASREEIEEISEYLEGDLESVLNELRDARMRLAPGDEIDPTVDGEAA